MRRNSAPLQPWRPNSADEAAGARRLVGKIPQLWEIFPVPARPPRKAAA